MEKNKKTLMFMLAYMLLLAAFFALFKFSLLLGAVPSGSMEPTLLTHDYVIADRHSYDKREPSRGDIIIFYSDERAKHMVKRVIGLPGETVSFRDGQVYIDGNLLDEKYLDDTVTTEGAGTFTVPEDSVFVMGDNRGNSFDSRYWENPYVPYEKIEAKVVHRIPLGKLSQQKVGRRFVVWQ